MATCVGLHRERRDATSGAKGDEELPSAHLELFAVGAPKGPGGSADDWLAALDDERMRRGSL